MFTFALWKDREDASLGFFPLLYPVLSHSETKAGLTCFLSSGIFAETIENGFGTFSFPEKGCTHKELVPEKGAGSAPGAGEVATDSERFQVLGRGAGSQWVCGEGKPRSNSWGSD